MAHTRTHAHARVRALTDPVVCLGFDDGGCRVARGNLNGQRVKQAALQLVLERRDGRRQALFAPDPHHTPHPRWHSIHDARYTTHVTQHTDIQYTAHMATDTPSLRDA